MTISEILNNINNHSSKNDKIELLRAQSGNSLFKKLLEYTYDPYKQYYVVKVPTAKAHNTISEMEQWTRFFRLLNTLNSREITGNLAIHEVLLLFSLCSLENEAWMRKVLKRHLNIGITSKSINKAFSNLVPTFDVQLAHKFEEKRVKNLDLVALEPKYDGVRCIAVVNAGKVQLFSRKGKAHDAQEALGQTIVPELVTMDDGVFDGELFGEDFKTTIETVRREKNPNMDNVRKIQFHVWDWMPYSNWVSQKTDLTCQEAREHLEDLSLSNLRFLQLVQRDLVHPSLLQEYHDQYVKDGFEGAMVKTLDSTYKFGRGHNVMKFKSFDTDDLKVVGFEEGTGKYEGHLGALIVERTYKGNRVRVGVGSGFTDEQRLEIWENRSNYRDRTAEIKYFEVTPDGSLRFPVFLQWRLDK